MREKTGETLLRAGGRWDRLEQRFVGEQPETCARIKMEESQVEFTAWFARFLDDYREGYPRDVSLALVSGDRRGGKTFDTYFCQIAALLDVPANANGLHSIGWTISRTYRHRDELDQLIFGYIPPAFYTAQRAPEHRFTFAHGSILRNLSADDPEALKQGRCDFLLYNEAQLMSPRAIKNGLYGTADAGGLCVLAANPPSGPEGEWLRDLKEAIEEDGAIKPLTRFFNFSSRDNSKIDQPARRRVARLAAKIDPAHADADAEGVWRRWGELACPSFKPFDRASGGNVGRPPDLPAWQDVTVSATLERTGHARGYSLIVGADFQRRPGCVAVAFRLFQRLDGKLCYFAEKFIGADDTEDDLARRIEDYAHERGLSAPDVLIVADATGRFQDGAHRPLAKPSHQIIREWQFIVVGPDRYRSAKGVRGEMKNPDVADSLSQFYDLCSGGRLLVSSTEEWIVEALRRCKVRKRGYSLRLDDRAPGYSHAVDCCRYVTWYMEPRRGPGIGEAPVPDAANQLRGVGRLTKA